MNIIQKIFVSKCTVCRRTKRHALQEQAEKLHPCAIDHCPFHADVVAAIQAAQKLELIEFSLSQSEVLEGEYFTITWKTINCKRMSIDGYGPVDPSGQLTIHATSDRTDIQLEMEDLFGKVFTAKLPVKILPRPTFEFIELRDNLLSSERLFFRYKTANAKRITVTDDEGQQLSELGASREYNSPPFYQDKRLYVCVTGTYGGDLRIPIDIKVYPPPNVSYFRCDQTEKVDTMPFHFEFDYSHAIKAELHCDSTLVADVTGLTTYTFIAENKTGSLLSPKIELLLTSQTGTIFRTLFPRKLTIYPQPSIQDVAVSPDAVILFPQGVALSYRGAFCEKVLFVNGHEEQEIIPGGTIMLNPDTSTTYTLTPVGKLGFIGEPRAVFVEVCHPVTLQATADKKITLQNVPVTITWISTNHTAVHIQPGNIDVTGADSYPIRLDTATEVRVVASNKKDKKEVVLFVEVLSYPRVPDRLFAELPRLDLQLTPIDGKKRISLNTYSLSGQFIRHVRKVLNGSYLHFNRSMRRKLFDELKSITAKKRSV